MNNIPRGTSRAKLTRFLLGQSAGPSRMHHEKAPQVVFGCAIFDSRLDDELSVATIEFSDTPSWLLSQGPSGFPKHTNLGTIWPGVDRVAIDAQGQTEFIRAVLNCLSGLGPLYVEMLAEFSDTDVNVQDHQGRTALHWACAESLADMVGLCQSIPDFNTGLRDNDNLTAFDIALRTGPDNIPDMFYTSMMEIEEVRPQEALLRVLTMSSDEIDPADRTLFPGEALFEPIGDRNSPLVLALLDRGVELTTKDEAGNTALHIAAGLVDNVEVVTRLLEAGADINAVGNGGATPLHSATCTADSEMVQLLVDFKADITLMDEDHMTALARAVENGKLEVQPVLEMEVADSEAMTEEARNVGVIELAAHPVIHEFEMLNEAPTLPTFRPHITKTDPHGSTTLLEAARDGDLDRVRALLADGVEIEVAGEDGLRPLHYAANGGHTEVVKELLAAGAEIESMGGRFGSRPLHYAALGGHTGVVKELLTAGAEMEAVDNTGDRPLHDAVRGGHTEIVKELLAAGAQVQARTRDGETAYLLAYKRGRTDILTILRPHVSVKEIVKLKVGRAFGSR